MVGIISYGAYLPLWRLSRDAITRGAPGEKAVCNFDEDSITMAEPALTATAYPPGPASGPPS